MLSWELKFKLYTIKRFYISKSVYAPKLVNRTGVLAGLKLASIDQIKKVACVASLVPAYAGKLTKYDGTAEKFLTRF